MIIIVIETYSQYEAEINMTEYEEVLHGYLENKGLRVTIERLNILKAVSSINGHFDAEELYNKLKKDKKKFSRATIYRAIPLFIKSGIIKESLQTDNKSRYELSLGSDHHDHLFCIKCGKIIEFKNNKLEETQDEVCKNFNFKPIDHKLSIRGYCKDCINKLRN